MEAHIKLERVVNCWTLTSRMGNTYSSFFETEKEAKEILDDWKKNDPQLMRIDRWKIANVNVLCWLAASPSVKKDWL